MITLFDNIYFNIEIKTFNKNNYNINIYYENNINNNEILINKLINYKIFDYDDFDFYVIDFYSNFNYQDNMFIKYIEIKNKNNWCICHFIDYCNIRIFYCNIEKNIFKIQSFNYDYNNYKLKYLLISYLNHNYNNLDMIDEKNINYKEYINKNDKYKLYINCLPNEFQKYLLINNDELNLEIMYNYKRRKIE